MYRQFHRLIEPLRPNLFHYFLRLTGSPFDAEDLVQETQTRAFGRLFQLSCGRYHDSRLTEPPLENAYHNSINTRLSA